MRDLSKLPSITPEMLANAPPPGASGAFRFSLDSVPEHEKAFLTREFFGRSVVKYDVERARDAAKFEIDVTLQMMPGLMMMSGRSHGSCNRRTREMVALENSDDVGMVVNMRGEHRVTLGQRRTGARRRRGCASCPWPRSAVTRIVRPATFWRCLAARQARALAECGRGRLPVPPHSGGHAGTEALDQLCRDVAR